MMKSVYSGTFLLVMGLMPYSAHAGKLENATQFPATFKVYFADSPKPKSIAVPAHSTVNAVTRDIQKIAVEVSAPGAGYMLKLEPFTVAGNYSVPNEDADQWVLEGGSNEGSPGFLLLHYLWLNSYFPILHQKINININVVGNQ